MAVDPFKHLVKAYADGVFRSRGGIIRRRRGLFRSRYFCKEQGQAGKPADYRNGGDRAEHGAQPSSALFCFAAAHGVRKETVVDPRDRIIKLFQITH